MIRRVASWFRDAAVRRVVKYGLAVSIGKALGQVASLVSVAILARVLGLEQFGVLALIRTVAGVTEAYANFNTWQAVIKYGAAAIAANKPDDVKRIIKLSMGIDVLTAALGAVVIVGLAYLIPGAFGWTSHQSLMCAIYAITVLTRTAGTCDGIFRICNAYRTQAFGDVLQNLMPMAAVIIAAATHAGFDGIVIGLTIGQVVGNIIDMSVAFWVAAKHGYGDWRKVSLDGARTRFPGIVHFILASNGQLTVKKTQAELDMILVGTMLGKAASGLFKLVKQIGKIPGLVFMPFEQVLFAELAHKAAEHKYVEFRRLLRRFAAIAFFGSIGVWAVTALVARPIVELLGGSEFVGAVQPLRIYLLAMAFQVANAPTQRALVALGRPGIVLVFDLFSLGLLLGAGIAAAHFWGINGVAGAVLLHKMIQLTWSTALVERVLREHRREQLNAATAQAH